MEGRRYPFRMHSWKVLFPLGILIAIVFFKIGDEYGDRTGGNALEADSGLEQKGAKVRHEKADSQVKAKSKQAIEAKSNVRPGRALTHKHRTFGKTTSQIFEPKQGLAFRSEPRIEIAVTEKSVEPDSASPRLDKDVGTSVSLMARSHIEKELRVTSADALAVGKQKPLPRWWGTLLRDLKPGGKLRFRDGRGFQALEESYRRREITPILFRGGRVVEDIDSGIAPGEYFCRFQLENHDAPVDVFPHLEFEVEKAEIVRENELSGIRVTLNTERDGKRAIWVKSFECLGRESDRHRVGSNYFTGVHIKGAVDLDVTYIVPAATKEKRLAGSAAGIGD
jgi:hypothetical protein